MTRGVTIQREFHVKRGPSGSVQLRTGAAGRVAPTGRVPHVARLMALAIRFESLIRDGVVAELARLGQTSRARLTQIMNLLNLAPDIQEQLLFLDRTQQGRDSITERHLRPITAEGDWSVQRRLWQQLLQEK